jgi:hypothetical protein
LWLCNEAVTRNCGAISEALQSLRLGPNGTDQEGSECGSSIQRLHHVSLIVEEHTSHAVGGYPRTSEAKAVSSDSADFILSDTQPLGREVGDNVSKLLAAPNSGKGPMWERAPVANLMPPGEAVDPRAAVPAGPAPFVAPTDDGPLPTPLDRHNEAALPAPSPCTPTEAMPAQERRQPVLPVVPPNVPRPPAPPVFETPGVQRRPGGLAVARTPQEAVPPTRREAERKSTSEVPRRDPNLGSPSGAGTAGPSLPVPLRPTR